MQLSHPLKCHRMEACCVAMFTIQWFRTGGDFDHICATCCFQKTQYSELKGTDCEFAGVTRLFTPGRLGTQSTECNKLDYTFFLKIDLWFQAGFLKCPFEASHYLLKNCIINCWQQWLLAIPIIEHLQKKVNGIKFAMQNASLAIKIVLLLCLEVPKECPKSPRRVGWNPLLSHVIPEQY